jgi:2-amino-4-hydroxy-6-hydroxymethyldihydropteridine diphosphokinase
MAYQDKPSLVVGHLAYIGLGSNLCYPVRQLERALRSLHTFPKTELKIYSSFYRTAPMGLKNQPAYINAVAVLNTQLTPRTLLTRLHNVERNQGRVRTIQRWGPRTLDLDLLLYDNVQLKSSWLTLPHPGLLTRDFVLYPLYECAQTLVLPNGRKLSDLVGRNYEGRKMRHLQRLDSYDFVDWGEMDSHSCGNGV